MKFVTISDSSHAGKPTWINVDAIVSIRQDQNGGVSTITLSTGKFVYAIESPEEILNRIKN